MYVQHAQTSIQYTIFHDEISTLHTVTYPPLHMILLDTTRITTTKQLGCNIRTYTDLYLQHSTQHQYQQLCYTLISISRNIDININTAVNTSVALAICITMHMCMYTYRYTRITYAHRHYHIMYTQLSVHIDNASLSTPTDDGYFVRPQRLGGATSLDAVL